MTFLERLEQASASLVVAAFVGAASGVGWLIRRIFTNQKQIELMQREIEHRDSLRTQDRQELGELREDVREVRKGVGEMRSGMRMLLRGSESDDGI